MSKRKANKPWLGWTIGEKRTLPFPTQRKSKRYLKSIKRRQHISQLLSEREDEVSSMGMDASPKAPSVLSQNISYLEDQIDELYKKVETLLQLLVPILKEPSPEAAEKSPGYESNTALSAQIGNLNARLSSLNERLYALTQRIDL